MNFQSSTWGDHLLHPEGLVGELADQITRTAIRPQPKFSLAGALTTCASLLGRGVKDVSGQYTNLYAFILGYSNGGKDHPAKYPLQIFDLLKRGKVVGGRQCSDSALEILLHDFPIRHLMLDEIGHYFGSLKSAGQQNPHLKTVLPALTELWSVPVRDGTYIGKNRAKDNGGNWKPPVKIATPVVSVYATGSPDRLFESMTFDDLADGSITRYLCFSSFAFPSRDVKPAAPFPTDLLQRISDALDKLGLGAEKYEGNSIAPTARTVPEDKDAHDLFETFGELTDEYLQKAAEGDAPFYLYGKAVENARRVALIVECLRNPDNPCIGQYAANYAIELVTHSVCDMIKGVRANVANSIRERESKNIENVIRRAGKNGIEQSSITMQTRGIDPRERKSILLDLIEAGIIREYQKEGKGRKRITCYAYVPQ